MQVYLEENDGIGCIFRILPRYKVQSVGEEVHYNDQVKLESIATEGQFLHCSEKMFEVGINKNWYELCIDDLIIISKHTNLCIINVLRSIDAPKLRVF